MDADSSGRADRMHVMYLTSRFPSPTLTFVANEMTAVRDRGHEVSIGTVWAPLDGHDGHAIEAPLRERVVPMSYASVATLLAVVRALIRRPSVLGLIASLVPGHVRNRWLFAKLLAAIPRGLFYGDWAARNGVDRFHAHFLTSPTTVAMIAAKVAGVPFSATAHAFDITSTIPSMVNASVPEKCRAADVVITISEFNRHDMLTRWPELDDVRLEVVYNGIDTSLFSPDRPHPPFANDGPIRLISVSALTSPKKGHDDLMRAVVELESRGVDAQLDIFGTGVLYDELVALASELGVADRVTLRGSATQEELAVECQRADIFGLACVVLESDDADGLPTVLIEALATGLPTISTQVTGVPEIVRDGETGRCVPSRDIQAFADAIEWMAEHPDDAIALAAAGRELVLESFDRNGAAERLELLWSSG